MKINPSTEPDCMTLAEETVSFGGMILNYQLLVRRNTLPARFWVRVASGSEQSESIAGDEIGNALKSYRAVVHGRVTPCGLHDVMYDLCRSE